jgi:8-oxo-dGTP diphosphatase
LLIHKKTGLGRGKVNAPGGKLEADETFEMCARREVEEELNICVGALTHVAELRFLMSDYEDILCHAFFTDEFEGVPIETREADPIWVPIHQIPWSQMWADDVYWIPRVLIGERLLGAFSFVGEVMQTMKVEPLGERSLLSVSLEDL